MIKKKYNHEHAIIVAGGLVLTMLLFLVVTMADTEIALAQQQDMSAMSNMKDRMMMGDSNMSSTANMSDMMKSRMLDMMDRMNKMMDMMIMMMNMPVDSDTTGIMSMSNGNINMGSMKNQTGDMIS